MAKPCTALNYLSSHSKMFNVAAGDWQDSLVDVHHWAWTQWKSYKDKGPWARNRIKSIFFSAFAVGCFQFSMNLLVLTCPLLLMLQQVTQHSFKIVWTRQSLRE